VRAVVVLEHKVGRLEAEAAGVEWRDPEAVGLARMRGIRRSQQAEVERRMRAVTAALIHLATRRTDPSPKELAARVAVELGAPFFWRSLYRKPYKSMWRTSAEVPDPHVADTAASTNARSRWSRRELVHRLRLLEPRHDALRAARRVALVAESEREGWTAIPDHPRPGPDPVDDG